MTDDRLEAVATAIDEEVYRQYREGRSWDEAKEVVEGLDYQNLASVALHAADTHVGWRPIETAPRDGELVDLWCVGEEDDIRFYCRDAFGRRSGRVTECCFIDGAWRPYMGLTRGMILPLDPTHWMPLPEAPV